MATITQSQASPVQPLIRWRFAWIFVAGIALIIVTVNDEKFLPEQQALWFLNWVHVFFGLAWTGIDLFMGFLLGPILRRLDPRLRRTVSQELSWRFFWLFPMLSTVTPTAGWELARRLGYLDVPYPGFYWVEAALALVIIMAFFGICILAPVNLWVLWETRKPEPQYGDGTEADANLPRHHRARSAASALDDRDHDPLPDRHLSTAASSDRNRSPPRQQAASSWGGSA